MSRPPSLSQPGPVGRSRLDYEGSNFLRARLVLATLTGKTVRIRKIRARDENPGLRESEASLIRLLDKLTNGSRIEVSETGTALLYQPGLLSSGGRPIDHDCSLERGLGYYLEPLLCLAAFGKEPLNVTLKGVTNHPDDPSPDLLRDSCLSVLKRFILVDEGLELKVQKRGAAPAGGGQVLFKCPVRRTIRPVQITDQGKIKRIRGVAWAVRVSPAVTNAMVESAKGILLKFLPDIYIYTDHMTGSKSGKSPGFGLTLTAETTTGVFYSAEVTSEAGERTVAADLATQGAHRLLEEIYRGGCADSTSQSLLFLMMALGPRDVSRAVTGPLSNYSIAFLRHLRDFFQVVFKLENYKSDADANTANDDEDDDLRMGAEKVRLACVGIGYTNKNKRTI